MTKSTNHHTLFLWGILGKICLFGGHTLQYSEPIAGFSPGDHKRWKAFNPVCKGILYYLSSPRAIYYLRLIARWTIYPQSSFCLPIVFLTISWELTTMRHPSDIFFIMNCSLLPSQVKEGEQKRGLR